MLRFYFKNPPPDEPYHSWNTKTITAPYDGQTFTFVNRGGDDLVVYLGEKSLYDEAININDLLAASVIYQEYLISIGRLTHMLFGYENQKMPNPDVSGAYMANPTGTKVWFMSMGWSLGAVAISDVLGTVTTSGAAVGDEYGHGDTDIHFTDVVSPSVEATATIEALRIENNPKKVSDYA